MTVKQNKKPDSRDKEEPYFYVYLCDEYTDGWTPVRREGIPLEPEKTLGVSQF